MAQIWQHCTVDQGDREQLIKAENSIRTSKATSNHAIFNVDPRWSAAPQVEAA
jgi:hypothetical protein